MVEGGGGENTTDEDDDDNNDDNNTTSNSAREREGPTMTAAISSWGLAMLTMIDGSGDRP